MRIDIYHHPDPSLERKVDHILNALEIIGVKIMASLEDVLADVTEEKSQIAGLSTLISGLKQQLADALAGTTLPPDVQAKVDAIFAAAESNKADLAAALSANTPSA